MKRPSFVPFPLLSSQGPQPGVYDEKEDTGMSNAPISIMYSLCAQPESSAYVSCAHLFPFIMHTPGLFSVLEIQQWTRHSCKEHE